MHRRLRSQLSYANVMATIAVFFALGGGIAVATHPLGDNTIDSGDIINGQVLNPDIGSSAVTGDKVFDNTLTGDDILESRLGKVPSAGRADRALSAVTADSAPVQGLERLRDTSDFDSTSPKVEAVFCPNGKAATGAGARVGGDNSSEVAVTEISYSPFSGLPGGAVARAVETDPTGQGWNLHVEVICAKVP